MPLHKIWDLTFMVGHWCNEMQTYATQRAAIEQAATARGDIRHCLVFREATGAKLARPELDEVCDPRREALASIYVSS